MYVYICIYITDSSRALTTNALSLLSYQPPQPPQPMYIYIYIYIYNVARHFTNTAQMSGRCVLQAFVVDFYICIVTVFLFFFF